MDRVACMLEGSARHRSSKFQGTAG